ncbi:MAG: hypothetical protein ACREB8_17025 [Pseudolabrys sp.]
MTLDWAIALLALNAKPSDRQVNAMLLKIFIKTSYWTEMEPCAFLCPLDRDALIHVSTLLALQLIGDFDPSL